MFRALCGASTWSRCARDVSSVWMTSRRVPGAPTFDWLKLHRNDLGILRNRIVRDPQRVSNRFALWFVHVIVAICSLEFSNLAAGEANQVEVLRCQISVPRCFLKDPLALFGGGVSVSFQGQ